nr:hypothetical protein [Catenuloplanes nepalensis]
MSSGDMRTQRQSSRPFIEGMRTSVSTAIGVVCSMRRAAVKPSRTHSTWNPAPSTDMAIRSRRSRSSSATITSDE